MFKLDPEGIENGALTIFGEFGSEAHNKFVSNHPEIAVDVSGDYTSDIETLTQAMVADTGAYDVLMMGLSYMPVERLIEKGYCADLSQSADIMEKVSAMYPEVVEPLMVDGQALRRARRHERNVLWRQHGAVGKPGADRG